MNKRNSTVRWKRKYISSSNSNTSLFGWLGWIVNYLLLTNFVGLIWEKNIILTYNPRSYLIVYGLPNRLTTHNQQPWLFQSAYITATNIMHYHKAGGRFWAHKWGAAYADFLRCEFVRSMTCTCSVLLYGAAAKTAMIDISWTAFRYMSN